MSTFTGVNRPPESQKIVDGYNAVKARVVGEIRKMFVEMTPEIRMDFITDLLEGYCPRCGDRGLPCNCDE